MTSIHPGRQVGGSLRARSRAIGFWIRSSFVAEARLRSPRVHPARAGWLVVDIRSKAESEFWEGAEGV
jgi:hypothetical protein